MRTSSRGTVTPLDHLHRVGAVVFGVGLAGFGILGLWAGPEMFSTTGRTVLGLSSNGLLAVISIAVGAVLVAAGLRGGRTASTILVIAGSAFVLSGLVNAIVLGTPAEPAGVPDLQRGVQLRRRSAAPVPRRVGPLRRAPARRQPVPTRTPRRRRARRAPGDVPRSHRCRGSARAGRGRACGSPAHRLARGRGTHRRRRPTCGERRTACSGGGARAARTDFRP